MLPLWSPEDLQICSTCLNIHLKNIPGGSYATLNVGSCHVKQKNLPGTRQLCYCALLCCIINSVFIFAQVHLVMVTDNQLKAFVLCVEHQALNAYVWYTCLLILFKRKKILRYEGVLPTERDQAINILSKCNCVCS